MSVGAFRFDFSVARLRAAAERMCWVEYSVKKRKTETKAGETFSSVHFAETPVPKGLG